jgi:hypothetical protein
VTAAKGFGILCLSGLLSLSAFTQKPGEHHPPAQPNQPRNNTQGSKGGPAPAAKMGEWLNQHKNLSPEEQEKLLENDPGFKRLPPDRQAALRERLRKFNSLTPQQRERALNRMQWMASLTPQQRQDLREANQTLQGLPQDRQVMVHKALRHLRQMDPQQRQQIFESERFKNTFSDQERGILTKLAAINPPEGNPEPPSNGRSK